jgi:hypothetical protein
MDSSSSELLTTQFIDTAGVRLYKTTVTLPRLLAEVREFMVRTSHL